MDTARAAALAEIAGELTAICDRLRQRGLKAEVAPTAVGEEGELELETSLVLETNSTSSTKPGFNDFTYFVEN